MSCCSYKYSTHTREVWTIMSWMKGLSGNSVNWNVWVNAWLPKHTISTCQVSWILSVNTEFIVMHNFLFLIWLWIILCVVLFCEATKFLPQRIPQKVLGLFNFWFNFWFACLFFNTERGRQILSISYYTPQVLLKAMAGSGWTLDPGTPPRYPTRLAATQRLQVSLATSQWALRERWVRSEGKT